MESGAELFDQAVRHHRSGALPQAEQLYRQILKADPDNADAHVNLGILLKQQSHLIEAVRCFREALRANPDHFAACLNLGISLTEQRLHAEAVPCLRQALLLQPDFADGHFHLGNALYGTGQLAEAAECYRQTVRLSPTHAEAYYNLGKALDEMHRSAEAVPCYRQTILLNPNHVHAHNNLGNALLALGRPAEAAACFQRALQLHPGYVDAHTHLGNTFVVQRRFDEAAACYQRALAIDPTHSLTLWNRTHLRFLHGDFGDGWHDYEQRWAQPGIKPRSFQQPRWDGSALDGKTILVYAEQGLGDTIQFVRYLPMVQNRGGHVLFECQPVLLKLLAGLAGANQVVPAGVPLPPFDVQIPLLSLPGLFGTTLANIPAQVPYLAVDPRLIEHWGRELSDAAVAGGSPLNVGIVWQSNPNIIWKGYLCKSAALKNFEALARLENVRLVSLQIGPATEQLAQVPFLVVDLGNRFNPRSLDDLAAAIMNMDLVITVDTAAAHLAGALGKPVWTLLSFAACWRWLLERSDSPWYPTMRLFRQERPGDWAGVMERVACELIKGQGVCV